MSAFIEQTFLNRRIYSKRWLIKNINELFEMTKSWQALCEDIDQTNDELRELIKNLDARITVYTKEINKLTKGPA